MSVIDYRCEACGYSYDSREACERHCATHDPPSRVIAIPIPDTREGP